MNKPCLNCGRLITVPDIPLPYGYTQKCKGCGFDNPVADDDPLVNEIQQIREKSTKSATKAGAGTAGNSARVQIHPTGVDTDHSEQLRMEQLLTERIGKELRSEFELKLRSFEAKMNLLLQQNHAIAQQSNITASQPHEQSEAEALAIESKKRVAVGEALVFTQTAAIFRVCEEALGKLGFKMVALSNVAQLLQGLKSKNYQVIILDQKVLHGDEGKAVLSHIKTTHLPVRRCQATLLITPNLPSFESQVFYQWGIDLNLHPRDLEHLDEHLQRLIEIRGELLQTYLANILA